MPLWSTFTDALGQFSKVAFNVTLVNSSSFQCSESHLADLNNIGKIGGGGSCTAAAFLKEFTEAPHWMHFDIAGVSGVVDASEIPYLTKGMHQ